MDENYDVRKLTDRYLQSALGCIKSSNGVGAKGLRNFQDDYRNSKGDKGHEYFVALSGKKVVGLIGYSDIPDSEKGFEVTWLYVRKTYLRQKIGTLLFDHMIKVLKKRKPRILRTETSSKYLKARRFYKRVGFRLAARVKDFYEDGDDKLIYMGRFKRFRKFY